MELTWILEMFRWIFAGKSHTLSEVGLHIYFDESEIQSSEQLSTCAFSADEILGILARLVNRTCPQIRSPTSTATSTRTSLGIQLTRSFS